MIRALINQPQKGEIGMNHLKLLRLKFIGSKTLWINSITGQGISLNGKVPLEILPEKCHITWVLFVLLFTEEFQMEPLAHNAILYDTRPTTK